MRTFLQRTSEELFLASRFTLVGIGATLIHMSVVCCLIVQVNVRPLLANLVAFLTAFTFSFIGQHRWTFRSNRRYGSALPRFLTVSLVAFLVNNFVLVVLLDSGILPPVLTAVLSASLIPVFTYLVGRFWVFG